MAEPPKYDVVQRKDIPNRDKPYWFKIGAVFEYDGKLSLKLDALPIPNKDGEVWLNLYEPREGGQGSRNDDFSF